MAATTLDSTSSGSAPVPKLKPSRSVKSRFSSERAEIRKFSTRYRVQAGCTPSSRKVALSSTSSWPSIRSGSPGTARPGTGRKRRVQRPCSPSSRPNRSSQSPSIPTRRADDNWLGPNAKRHISSTCSACCTAGGANTSRPSGSIGSTSAPACRNRPAANACIRPCSCDAGCGAPVSGGIELISEQRLVELLNALVALARGQQLALQRGKGLLAVLLGALQPSLQHERGKLLLLVDLAQDRADLAHHQLEHVDLFIEDAQHRILDRPRGDQVEDEHLTGLADAVDAPHALLDRHRIPRNVEVDERVAELQITSLTAGFCAEEQRHLFAE